MQVDLPKLSIIFPNLNGDKKNLSQLLESIIKSSYPKNKLEVVMVDNGSSDESVDFVKKLYPQIMNIRLLKNYGFARAVNIGIRKSAGNYIFVTNNDIKLDKDCLKTQIVYLLNNPNIGIVGPKIYDFDKKTKILATGCRQNFFTGSFTLLADPDKTQEVDWVAGCGMTFSKNLWQALKGFDEGFFFTGEDVDFALRAKKIGANTIYLPKSIIWHKGGATISKPEFSKFKTYHIYRSKIRLILKHGNMIQILTGLCWQLLISIPYNVLLKNPKNLLSAYKAIVWNIKNPPKKFEE